MGIVAANFRRGKLDASARCLMQRESAPECSRHVYTTFSRRRRWASETRVSSLGNSLERAVLRASWLIFQRARRPFGLLVTFAPRFVASERCQLLDDKHENSLCSAIALCSIALQLFIVPDELRSMSRNAQWIRDVITVRKYVLLCWIGIALSDDDFHCVRMDILCMKQYSTECNGIYYYLEYLQNIQRKYTFAVKGKKCILCQYNRMELQTIVRPILFIPRVDFALKAFGIYAYWWILQIAAFTGFFLENPLAYYERLRLSSAEITFIQLMVDL